MNTPIYDFVKEFNENNVSRFFMPGHKGRCFLGIEFEQLNKYDITEITGADALFVADGIIDESEKNATKLFGSRETIYSAGGSTLCIQTMLSLVKMKGKKIIAGRNAHMSFINSCILLGLQPIWVLPKVSDKYGVCGLITADQIEEKIKQNPDAVAVYITAPDYLGNVCDIKQISKVCDRYGVDLLCDNAHGAYLKFADDNKHPLDLGVTMCCDSAHKTLPVLTGGAYLHLSDKCKYAKSEVKNIMNMFGSTSPSYLILQSLDLCNWYLENRAKNEYKQIKTVVKQIKDRLKSKNIPYLENEIDFCKITIDANKIGYTGDKLKSILYKYGIECEYSNSEYVVLLISPFLQGPDYNNLFAFIDDIKVKKEIYKNKVTYTLPEVVLSPKEAFEKDFEIVNVEESQGRICAQTISLCPPGVPVIMCGEKINNNVKKILKNSGNIYIKVVK